jgi:glycosyltransferase involved in cell wall biosynthesis
VLDTHGGADDPLDAPGVHVDAMERGATRVVRLAFVMEQHLGHRTYADNLRTALGDVADLDTHWIPVRYDTTSAWWERIPVEGLRAAWRGRTEVRRGLAGIDVDACIFNTQVPAMLGGRRARRTPYVLCMDDTPRLMDSVGAAHYSHRPDAGPVGWAKYRYNRHILQNAAGLAPWSNWARASLVDDYGVDPTRIEVIPPGVDVSAWQPADHAGDGPMKILFVGFDFERKGGDVLLRAFEALPAGSAELRIVTQSPVPARPGVEVHRGLSPNDPALRDLFRTSDLFVLPSVFEMFGIAAVEAAAAGLPLIVTSVGGLGDLVVDGVTGFSMAPGDVDALAGHLQVLAEQPALRRKLGAAARQRAELEFDAVTNARRLVALAVRSAGLG